MMVIVIIGLAAMVFATGYITGARDGIRFGEFHPNEDVEKLIQMNRELMEELARVKSNL